jgi:pimeloyl-ACP methyl ester carboxylesterase
VAWRLRAGDPARPTIVWFGGFRSDMASTKATHLDAVAAREGRAFLRFDYSGHGDSGGRFEDGTVGRWLEEGLAVVEQAAPAPARLALVGSSMGGWIALLAARRLAARLAGLVLIAPAVDFTEALMWASMDEAARRAVMEEGVWLRPSAYSDDPYPIARGLIEDGRRHLLMGSPVRAHAPVQILQGMEDPDVPWRHALALFESLTQDPATLTLVRDGDHRLSRPQDLALLDRAIAAIV